MKKSSALTRWKPSMGFVGSTPTTRTASSIISLGLLVGGTAFTYGVARDSTSPLVKTAGYATAGLLAFSLLAGAIMAATE